MTTTIMNISLPEAMKSFVEKRLISDGYGTASEYVRELIREDRKRREEEKLERLLLARLESESELTSKKSEQNSTNDLIRGRRNEGAKASSILHI